MSRHRQTYFIKSRDAHFWKVEIQKDSTDLKNDFENQNFAIFEELLSNFGRSDHDKNNHDCHICGFMPNSHTKS